jgi:hypothetical protein
MTLGHPFACRAHLRSGDVVHLSAGATACAESIVVSCTLSCSSSSQGAAATKPAKENAVRHATAVQPQARTKPSCASRTRVRVPLMTIVWITVPRSKLFSVMRSRFALSEACEHPLVLGPVVKRGMQPGAGTSLAGLNNSRCGSDNGCYGISRRPFIASDNLCERFS